MKRLVEEIKQIINEFHGVQFDIKTLSQQLAEEVISRINLELEKINDGNIWDLISQIRLNSGYSKKLGIGLITTKIEYQNSNKKPYGAYKTNELKIQDDGTYSVVISLNVFKELNKDNIVSIISHELNHAYVDIKSINGDRKSAKYNKANKKMKVDLKHLSNEFSEVKEFINMSYLSNSLEVQARVQ